MESRNKDDDIKYFVYYGYYELCVYEFIPARFYSCGSNIEGVSTVEQMELFNQKKIIDILNKNPISRRLCLRYKENIFESGEYSRWKVDKIFHLYIFNKACNNYSSYTCFNNDEHHRKYTALNNFVFNKLKEAFKWCYIINYSFYNKVPNNIDFIYNLK